MYADGRHYARSYLQILALVCVISHILLGVYFAYIGVVFLVFLSTFDAIINSLIFLINRAWKVRAASFLLPIKVITFSMIATFLMGPNIHVQWLVLLIILPITTHLDFTKKQRIALLATVPLVANLQFIMPLLPPPPFDMTGNLFLQVFFANVIVFGFLVELVASAILTNKTFDSQAKDIRSYRDMSYIDPLTKLNNRRYADDFFEKLQGTKDIPYVFCLLDIDDFKIINDTYGHNIGDNVLVSIAGVIRQSIRQTDLACRWGGEEFLIALADCKIDTGRVILNKVKANIQNLKTSTEYGDISVTVTGGASPMLDNNIKQTLAICDKKLYEGKRDGKNQIVI